MIFKDFLKKIKKILKRGYTAAIGCGIIAIVAEVHPGNGRQDSKPFSRVFVFNNGFGKAKPGLLCVAGLLHLAFLSGI